MAILNKSELIKVLTRLGQLAHAEGKAVELMVVGGGVMVLEFESRPATRDLDVVILSPPNAQWVRSLGAKVAREQGWPEDWMNDAVKGFMTGTTRGSVIFMAAGISVIRPSIEQLMAMKLCAWRDDVDISDARRLLQELPIDYKYDEGWSRNRAIRHAGARVNC